LEAIRINGPAVIKGTASLSGAKNAALPILVAAFASEGPVRLRNVPAELNDVRVLLEILRQMGGRIEQGAPGEVSITGTELSTHEVDPQLAGRIRSSLLFLGLLAGRKGRARLGVPGGCAIGDRKFDLHLKGLEALGAKVDFDGEAIQLEAGKLVGADISLPIATTSGTENLMIAACFAEGVTRIHNAHTRPEIIDLANMLNTFGADVRVFQRRIEIHGGRPLTGGTYRIMPAWDEAVTLLCAAAMTGGELRIRDLRPEQIPSDVLVLRQAGAEVFDWGGDVFLKAPRPLRPIHIVTGPFPGINSDTQAIYAAMAAMADGESTITDTRFPERFGYVEEFRKFGVDVDYYENCAVVRGVRPLRGAQAVARDLRCGAAAALLGLVAEGTTTLTSLYQLDRGYVRFEQTLRSLGVDAERVELPD
jgi:UDP-N-acetylglucosamine 1-carboxyvinyltransferase